MSPLCPLTPVSHKPIRATYNRLCGADFDPQNNSCPMRPVFFKSPADFRAWLDVSHMACGELWVSFYKKSSAKPSITYPEAVDEALCFGWIDGVRKSADTDAYTVRFTPRKPKSQWSAVNRHFNRDSEDGNFGFDWYRKRGRLRSREVTFSLV